MPDEWDSVLAEIEADSGSAAKTMLAAGHTIYYVKRDTPAGLLIKEYPDGRREFMRSDGSVADILK
jgi:hypothetical protein